MAVGRAGSLGVVSLAVVGVAALGVAPVAISPAVAAGVKTVQAAAKLLSSDIGDNLGGLPVVPGTGAIVIGGSGDPIPSSTYVTDVTDRYVDPTGTPFEGLVPNQLVFPFDQANPLFTPEGLYPFEGVKNLELDPSVAQGVQILTSAINNQLSAPGDSAVVLGYSQSAIIASQVMQNLLAAQADGQTVPGHDQLAFSLIGDIVNPNGGIFTRFDFPGMPSLTIPSLGITFSDATPSETPWDTAIYTQEYDGFADFPKYPLNLLADINAVLGIAFVHGTYPTLTADQLANAQQLAVSADYVGPLANTDYFMIPTENLPLLDLVRAVPLVGNPISDLLQPSLKVLIDLGYGNVDTAADLTNGTGGWDIGPANVTTPFELFPNVNPLEVLTALGTGIQMGVTNFVGDITGDGPNPIALSADMSALAANPLQSLDLTNPTDLVNAFSSALSQAYSALLPTVDIANALLTSMPAYDLELFTHFLGQGDILNAIGMPIGADFALVSAAGLGFELRVILNAVEGVVQSFDPDFTLSL